MRPPGRFSARARTEGNTRPSNHSKSPRALPVGVRREAQYLTAARKRSFRAECRSDRRFDVPETEGLHQVGRRTEGSALRTRRENARADDREILEPAA